MRRAAGPRAPYPYVNTLLCCSAGVHVVILPRLAPPESCAVPVQYAQRRGYGVLAAIVCSLRSFAHACGKACTRLQRV